MTPEQLKASILQYAVQGRLVEQRAEEGTAEELYQQIQDEKQNLIKEGKISKGKPLTSIVENEIPFDIPESWKWVRLPEIGATSLGKTLNKGTDVGEEVPYLCSINVYWDGINLDKVKKAKFTEIDKEKYLLQKGDLLVCEGGEVGRCAVWDNDIEMYYQNALHCIRFYGELNPHYFKYCFELYNHNRILENASKGMTIKHLVQGALYSIPFPLPPLTEQKRIVTKIEELLPFVDRYAVAYDKLEAFNTKFPIDMKKSILQYAIRGKLVEQIAEDGTGEVLYDKIKNEKQDLIKNGKIKKEKPLPEISDDEIPFDIPETWKWVRLDDIVRKSIKRGKSPTYTPESGTLVFAQKCNTKAGGINLELALFLDESKLGKYPEEEFMRDGDIVINSTGNGTLGRVGIYRKADNPRQLPVVPDSHVTVIRANTSVSVDYVYYVLKYYQPYMEKLGTGSTNQTELSANTVRALLFPLPPLAEQERIALRLGELLPFCDRLIKK